MDRPLQKRWGEVVLRSGRDDLAGAGIDGANQVVAAFATAGPVMRRHPIGRSLVIHVCDPLIVPSQGEVSA